MDPALRELLRDEAENPNRVIEAIIRLRVPDAVPGVRLIARFGSIATCRLRLGDVVAVRGHPLVASLKAARALGPDRREHVDEWRAPELVASPTDRRRPEGTSLTGAGVVVGAVDWGLDIVAECFRREDGGTRLLGLWDQRPAAGVPSVRPYGYGRTFTRQQIDAALATDDPYAVVDYYAADADAGGGSHGTHVMDIAAGNGRSGGPVGVACGADLVFVHLSDWGTGGLGNLGDSVRLLEGIDYIRRTAAGRPWVVNVSVGRHGGPHDGLTLDEMALDQLLGSEPGCFVVQSAGNYHRSATHTAGTVPAGGQRTFRFCTHAADTTPNELEIWYSGQDELELELTPPGGDQPLRVGQGQSAYVVAAGLTVGRVYSRTDDPNNHDHVIDAFLDETAPAGEWKVVLRGRRIVDGRFHAWIERDQACPDCQSRFRRSDVVRTTTTGTLANGRLPLVVGAYDGHQPDRPLATFSSAGPTRNDLPKPDLVACGVDVLAARSAPRSGTGTEPPLVRKSGTSMATPHVTGAVALCLEAGGAALTATQIREMVLSTTRPPPATADPFRAGRGSLDLPALVTMLEVDRRSRPRPTEKAMTQYQDVDDALKIVQTTPGRAYRELLYRPYGDVGRSVASGFTVLAGPGDPAEAATATGDLLVTVRLGQQGGGRCVELDRPLDVGGLGGMGRLGILPPGHLVLRPRNGVARSDDEQSPGKERPHVTKARALWTQLTLPKDVTMHDMVDVPAAVVRGAGFLAWTNSGHDVYVDASADAEAGRLPVTLFHEAVHVRQFRANGDRRPASYAHMIRFECDAYRATAAWANASTDRDIQRQAAPLQANADAFCDVIADLSGTGLGWKALNEHYKKALVTMEALPAHQRLEDLYQPDKRPGSTKHRAAEEWSPDTGPAAAEDENTDMDRLLKEGRSENDITNALFFTRNPRAAREPLRPGTAASREWTSIRDRVVRPGVRRALVIGPVSPVRLAIFLSQYEGDSRVPADVTRDFLTQPALLSLGRSLRDRVLSNWRGGGRPLTTSRFYGLAFDLAGDAGTALLLCHNVLKAFVRGGTAIRWTNGDRPGEYTDGAHTYVAKIVHSAGRLRFPDPRSGKLSIFYLLFSATELGVDDPGDWYHFFVTATMAAYGGAGALSSGRAGRSRTDDAAEDRGGRVDRAAYEVLVDERLLDLEDQLTDPALRAAPGNRGWVLANALSFLEGGFYGKDAAADQSDVQRESAVHLRGAVFGLRAVALAPGRRWRWYVPKAAALDKVDLAIGFRVRDVTWQIWQPNGAVAATAEEILPTEDSVSTEDVVVGAAPLLLDTEDDGYDTVRQHILGQLRLPFTDPDDPGLHQRRMRLRAMFARVPSARRGELLEQLRRRDPGDELARLFHDRLHHATRAELLAILASQPPPAVTPTPVPTPVFVSPQEPLPDTQRARFEAALRGLTAKVEASGDPRLWRYRCWFAKLAAGADDRFIPWSRICPRKTGALGAAYLVGPCDIGAGSAVDQAELQKSIHGVADVEPANSRLSFMTHLRPEILWITEGTSDKFHVDNLRQLHDHVQLAITNLDIWANNPMGGSSAMPSAYVAIKDWIGQRQRDPNSLYSCL